MKRTFDKVEIRFYKFGKMVFDQDKEPILTLQQEEITCTDLENIMSNLIGVRFYYESDGSDYDTTMLKSDKGEITIKCIYIRDYE